LIKGILPGVGKSYTASKYESEKKLFVSPYNKLCQQLRKDGHEAVTLNKLMGEGLCTEQNLKMKPLDVDEYDCIIFDEILLYNPYRLGKIKKYMDKYPNKRFIATGDCNQTKPIDFTNNNVKNLGEYQMFPNQITLRECKRLKSKEDVKKLMKLKEDIFNLKLKPMEIFEKYGFKIITKRHQVQTLSHVCFFNHTCNKVNDYVHDNLVEEPKNKITISKVIGKVTHKDNYWKGLELVSKGYFKSKNVKLNTNYVYEIQSINKDELVIKDIVDGDKMTVSTKLLKDKLHLNYAHTVHSVQGLSLKEEFTIFDADTSYVDRNWIWTAIKRTDDLSKITIFKNNDQTLESLLRAKRKQYFSMKVQNYKKQDVKANRPIDDENYIDVDWIRDTFRDNKNCYKCQVPFEIKTEEGSCESNLTVDRINNDLPHLKSNCKLCCVDCNRGKSNK